MSAPFGRASGDGRGYPLGRQSKSGAVTTFELKDGGDGQP
jgi:hypothetical protein